MRKEMKMKKKKTKGLELQISSKAPIFASISPKSQTLAHPQACQPPKVRTRCHPPFFPFKHSFSSEKWWGGNFLRDHAAAQYSGPKSCRGILFLCNSGSIWAAAQKLHIESCRGSVLFWWKLISPKQIECSKHPPQPSLTSQMFAFNS